MIINHIVLEEDYSPAILNSLILSKLPKLTPLYGRKVVVRTSFKLY